MEGVGTRIVVGEVGIEMDTERERERERGIRVEAR